MKDRVLLISDDVALAQRVDVLVQRLSVEVQWRHQFDPPSRWPAVPIVLLDEDCLPDDTLNDTPNDVQDEATAPMEADASERIGAGMAEDLSGAASHPIIVLLASQGRRRNRSLQIGFCDILYKDHRLSHLPWVLQEHLNVLRLRRVRQRQESEDEASLDPTVFSLRHEINNPLSGILGNAELALSGKAKMPADVRERLERIVQLARQIRELLRSPAAAEWMAGGEQRRGLGVHSDALLMNGTEHDASCSSLE